MKITLRVIAVLKGLTLLFSGLAACSPFLQRYSKPDAPSATCIGGIRLYIGQ